MVSQLFTVVGGVSYNKNYTIFEGQKDSPKLCLAALEVHNGAAEVSTSAEN